MSSRHSRQITRWFLPWSGQPSVASSLPSATKSDLISPLNSSLFIFYLLLTSYTESATVYIVAIAGLFVKRPGYDRSYTYMGNIEIDRWDVEDWAAHSRMGESCGIFGCLEKPVVRCDHCGNHYCRKHSFVIGQLGHRSLIPKEDL